MVATVRIPASLDRESGTQGPSAVIVDNVGLVLDCRPGGKIRRRKGRKALLVDCPYRHDANPVNESLGRACGLASHHVCAGAVVASHLVTECRHAACELGDDDLDAPLTGAVSLVAYHRNLQSALIPLRR